MPAAAPDGGPFLRGVQRTRSSSSHSPAGWEAGVPGGAAEAQEGQVIRLGHPARGVPSSYLKLGSCLQSWCLGLKVRCLVQP